MSLLQLSFREGKSTNLILIFKALKIKNTLPPGAQYFLAVRLIYPKPWLNVRMQKLRRLNLAKALLSSTWPHCAPLDTCIRSLSQAGEFIYLSSPRDAREWSHFWKPYSYSSPEQKATSIQAMQKKLSNVHPWMAYLRNLSYTLN